MSGGHPLQISESVERRSLCKTGGFSVMPRDQQSCDTQVAAVLPCVRWSTGVPYWCLSVKYATIMGAYIGRRSAR